MDDDLYSACIFYAFRVFISRNWTYKTKKYNQYII